MFYARLLHSTSKFEMTVLNKCVKELCGKDGVCESDVCVCEGGSSADFLFCTSAPMSSA